MEQPTQALPVLTAKAIVDTVGGGGALTTSGVSNPSGTTAEAFETVGGGGGSPPGAATDYQALQKYFSKESTILRLDEYAKWLFGVVALVGALATGFGTLQQQKGDLAKWIFVASVFCVGVSLASAAWSLRPRASSGGSSELNGNFDTKTRTLLVAVITFALALILAATANVLTASSVTAEQPHTNPVLAVGYEFDRDTASFVAILHGEHLPTDATVDFQVTNLAGDTLYAGYRGLVGDTPRVMLRQQIRIIPGQRHAFLVAGRWRTATDTSWRDERQFRFDQAMQRAVRP